MTTQERLAALNAAILAVRPHGFLADSVLEPLQTLRDDLAAESPPVAPEPVTQPPSPAPAVVVEAVKKPTAPQPTVTPTTK